MECANSRAATPRGLPEFAWGEIELEMIFPPREALFAFFNDELRWKKTANTKVFELENTNNLKYEWSQEEIDRFNRYA
jgi:hypothetical protein